MLNYSVRKYIFIFHNHWNPYTFISNAFLMIKVDVNLSIACALQIIGVPVGLNWNDQYHDCSVVLKKKNYIIRLIKESGIILLVFLGIIYGWASVYLKKNPKGFISGFLLNLISPTVFDNLIIFKKLFFITFIYIMFSKCTI